jgi:hypothetical protein
MPDSKYCYSVFDNYHSQCFANMENETETGEYKYNYRENTISIFMSR